MLKIKASWYPMIILGTFTFFLVLGMAIGFRPGHEGEERRGGGRLQIAPRVEQVVWA